MLPLVLTLLVGCATRVHMAMPPAPAVHLDEASIAVVSADRTCRPYASALMARLATLRGIRLDPRSDLRLMVFSCHHVQALSVEEVAGGDEGHALRRKGNVNGRAHAVVALSQEGRVVAHLLGTSRAGLVLEVDRSGPNLSAMGRTLQQRLVDAVAADLALQLSPEAWPVSRRVFPKAPEGSARDLYTEAVSAEAAGDLPRAYQLALAAQRVRPSSRGARYVGALERQIGADLASAFTPSP